MRRMVFGLAICLFWTLDTNAQIRQGTYRNDAFGFSVKLAPGWKRCESGGATTDHGIALLRHRWQRCAVESTEAGPSISIFALYYGVILELARDERELADCKPDARNVTAEFGPLLDGLAISALEPLVCRSLSRNGNVEIRARFVNEKQGVDPYAWTHLEVILSTPPAQYGRDIKTYKRVLSSMRFDPP